MANNMFLITSLSVRESANAKTQIIFQSEVSLFKSKISAHSVDAQRIETQTIGRSADW